MTDATTMIVDLLGRGHAVQFQVRGDSMAPMLRDHDYLHVEPAQPFGVGDIVLVLAERGLTAHRVIAMGEGTVITRGDNAPAADAAVGRERVLGKVTAAYREGQAVKLGRKGRIGLKGLIGRICRSFKSFSSFRSSSS